MILADAPLWFVRTLAFAFGLIWGSFLNVVIYRVPRDMSVVRPGSHCPACGGPLQRVRDLSPPRSNFEVMA